MSQTVAENSVAADPIKPMRLFQLSVSAVEQLSPHFRRITFQGPDLALFGANAAGETLDLRVKIMIPPPGKQLPSLSHINGSLQDDWYQGWRAMDESQRGVMRTYTVRSLRPGSAGGCGAGGASDAAAAHDSIAQQGTPAELDIDFVLHLDGGSGPAAQWAASARPGDALAIVGPCARWGDCLGIEFAPGEARRILLAGDETAVPAIAAILESLPPHISGHAVLEVPDAGDFMDLQAPDGVELLWLARGEREHGLALAEQLRTLVAPSACQLGSEPEDVDIDGAILWETPAVAPGHGLYAWIAGEAATVRDLRRYLVREVGMDRNAVAFMGYWRQGRALDS